MQIRTPQFSPRIKWRARHLMAEHQLRLPQNFYASTREPSDSVRPFVALNAPHTVRRRTPHVVAVTNEKMDWEFSDRVEFESPAAAAQNEGQAL